MERYLDEEFDIVKEKLVSMAALTEEAISLSISSLKDRKEDLAEQVLKQEKDINILDVELDELCLTLLARHQPMAVDLRFLTSVLRISSELERIADQAVNIAQRSLVLLKSPTLKPLIDIPRMALIAKKMVKDAVDAFLQKNADLAREVCERDDEVDNLNDQIFRELLTYMMQDSSCISRAVELTLIGRHLERIADHATNISEDVVYFVKGKTIKHHFEQH